MTLKDAILARFTHILAEEYGKREGQQSITVERALEVLERVLKELVDGSDH